MNGKHIILALIGLPLLVLVWHFHGRGIVAAPAVAMQALDGGQIDLRTLRGKPVLVTFWHTHCSSCIQEMPHLTALHREFSPQGFTVIGIAMSYDEPARIRRLRDKRGLPYPLVYDADGALAQAFGGVRATPTSFLIAPDGTVAHNQVGGMAPHARERLRARVAAMLAAG